MRPKFQTLSLKTVTAVALMAYKNKWLLWKMTKIRMSKSKMGSGAPISLLIDQSIIECKKITFELEVLVGAADAYLVHQPDEMTQR